MPVDKLAEFYGDGSDELGLAFNFNFISAPFRAPGDAGHRGGDRGGAAARGLAGLDGLEPRHVPLPHPLGRGRPGQGPPGAAHAAEPARHPGPLPGRRDRHGQRRAGPGGPARPPRRALLPVLRGAGRRAHAHAVERSPRGRVHRGRPPVAPARRPGRGQRGSAAGRPRLRCSTLCRDLIAFRRSHPGVQHRRHRVAGDARAGLGLDPGRPPRRRARTCRRRSVVLPGLPGTHRRSAPIAPAIGRPSEVRPPTWRPSTE